MTAEIAEGVRAAIAAYCHALDDGRTADVVALFTPDGSSTLPGAEPVTGHAALVALYDRVKPTRPQRHLALNVVVTAQGNDSATARTDLVFLAATDAGWTVALVGRYDDSLRRHGDHWLFASRTLTFQGPAPG